MGSQKKSSPHSLIIEENDENQRQLEEVVAFGFYSNGDVLMMDKVTVNEIEYSLPSEIDEFIYIIKGICENLEIELKIQNALFSFFEENTSNS